MTSAAFGMIATVAAVGLTGSPSEAFGVASPGACAGVQTVSGGYRLSRNVTCDFSWPGSNEVLNLNGHRLNGDFLPSGTGQTIKNGALVSNRGEYWANASNFTMTQVAASAGPTVTGFMIEAGNGLTVAQSSISDAPIGLGFYFGGAGVVRDTTFTRNGTGMTIQKGSGVSVVRNVFSGNQIGLRLWTEDNFGVNDNTIKGNLFDHNVAYGLQAKLTPPTFAGARAGEHNLIIGNAIKKSGGSGIDIAVHCTVDPTVGSAKCSGNGTVLQGNSLTGNGGVPPAPAPGVDPSNDGVTARGFLDVGSSASAYPAGLAGVTLSANVASRNSELGLDVSGVTDGGANLADRNGNPSQCVGVRCMGPAIALATGLGSGQLAAGYRGALVPALIGHRAVTGRALTGR